jgi:hypothetical protein
MPPEPGNPGVPLSKPAGVLPLPETVKTSLHDAEADVLALAEAEVLNAQDAEATDANISTPIVDNPTKISSFFTIALSREFSSESHATHEA